MPSYQHEFSDRTIVWDTNACRVHINLNYRYYINNYGKITFSTTNIRHYISSRIDIYVSKFYKSDKLISEVHGKLLLGGRVLVGVNTADSDFNTPMKTGGEKTHTLTIAEMPAHAHSLRVVLDNLPCKASGVLPKGSNEDGTNRGWHDYINWNDANRAIANTGGGSSHNNLQPYYTCYIFKRTN